MGPLSDLKIDSTKRVRESDIPINSDTRRLDTPIEEMIDSLKEMEQSMKQADDENTNKVSSLDDGYKYLMNDTLGQTQYRLETEF
jgi:hypothetical protein